MKATEVHQHGVKNFQFELMKTEEGQRVFHCDGVRDESFKGGGDFSSFFI